MGTPKSQLAHTAALSPAASDDRNPPQFHSMLVVITGKARPAFLLAEPHLRLGRSSECEILLEEPGISRHHASVITRDFRHFLLRDEGSTNGTFVNGERIRERELNDSDQIELGNGVALRFVGRRDLAETTGEFDAPDNVHSEDYLMRALQHQVRRAWDEGDVGVITVHVDHLALINDLHGPAVGDQVLDTVRNELTTRAKTRLGTVARLAGSYFMVLLPNHTSSEANDFAQEVVGELADDHSLRELEGTIAFSAGVASLQLLRASLRSPALDDSDVERHSSSLAMWSRSLCSSAQQRGGDEIVVAAPMGGLPQSTMTYRMPVELPALIERVNDPRYRSRYSGLLAFEIADETALIGHAGAAKFDRYFGYMLDAIAHSIPRESQTFVGRWRNRYAFAVVDQTADPQQLRRDVVDRWQARWPEGYDGFGSQAQVRQTYVAIDELRQFGERLPHLLRQRFDDRVATARAVKRDLPFPLEAPKVAVRARASTFSQVSQTLDALEVGFQLVAAIGFGLAAPRDPELVARLIADKVGTGPLSMGAWEELSWILARSRSTSGPTDALSPLFRALVTSGRRTEAALKLHAAVSLRNRQVVHTATRDEGGYAPEVVTATEALDALIAACEPLRTFEMVTVASTVLGDDGVSQTYTLRRHQGPVEQFPLFERTMNQRLIPKWCYLLPPEASGLEPISLAPFFFSETCQLCGRVEVYAADRPVIEPGARVAAKGITTGHEATLITPKSPTFLRLWDSR